MNVRNEQGTENAQPEALVAVVRPGGTATFHTQDCAHAQRAKRGLYALPEDFTPGDAQCSACRPEVGTQACGCPTLPGTGDVRCHVCREYVNVRCWNCKTPRGGGRCPSPAFRLPPASSTPEEA